jgi:hypothetical protein
MDDWATFCCTAETSDRNNIVPLRESQNGRP